MVRDFSFFKGNDKGCSGWIHVWCSKAHCCWINLHWLLLKITALHVFHVFFVLPETSYKLPHPRSLSNGCLLNSFFLILKITSFPTEIHFSWEEKPDFLLEHRLWHRPQECFGPGLNLGDAFAAAQWSAAGLVDGLGGTPAPGPGRNHGFYGFPDGGFHQLYPWSGWFLLGKIL